MKPYYKKIAFFICLIIVFTALRFFGLSHYLTLDNLKHNRQQLLTIVHAHYLPSILLYIITYIFIATCSIPVAAPLSLIGGFLFGICGAMLAINLGATIGATLTFLLFRYLLGTRLNEQYRTQLAAFNTNIQHYGAQYLLVARLVMFIPFFLINILAGIANIPITTFIWTTSVGIIPGSLVYAYAGKQIGTIDTLSDVFSPPIILAFVLLIALSIISILVKNQLMHKKLKKNF